MLALPLAVSVDVATALQLVPLALIALIYARRARMLALGAERVPGSRQASFYLGLVLAAAAVLALGSSSDTLLYLRTAELLLLGDLAPLLIVLGLSAALLAPLAQIRPLRCLRLLAHPALACSLWAINLYLWYLTSAYQAALRHAGLQVLQDAIFLGLGIAMWICLLGPPPAPAWFGERAGLIYVLALRISAVVLANIFLWSGTVFYPLYSNGDAIHHISPLADQNLAGAVMLLESALVTLGLFYWLFVRSTDDDGRYA
jgi:cytochrome c oxidase assembly factor CtaG